MEWFEYYLVGCGTGCALAVALVIAKRDLVAETLNGYGAFLRKPWKLGTFILAVWTMMIMAP